MKQVVDWSDLKTQKNMCSRTGGCTEGQALYMLVCQYLSGPTGGRCTELNKASLHRLYYYYTCLPCTLSWQLTLTTKSIVPTKGLKTWFSLCIKCENNLVGCLFVRFYQCSLIYSSLQAKVIAQQPKIKTCSLSYRNLGGYKQQL